MISSSRCLTRSHARSYFIRNAFNAVTRTDSQLASAHRAFHHCPRHHSAASPSSPSPPRVAAASPPPLHITIPRTKQPGVVENGTTSSEAASATEGVAQTVASSSHTPSAASSSSSSTPPPPPQPRALRQSLLITHPWLAADYVDSSIQQQKQKQAPGQQPAEAAKRSSTRTAESAPPTTPQLHMFTRTNGSTSPSLGQPITPGRSNSKSLTLSSSDAAARDAAFKSRIESVQRLHAAHINSPHDRHIQLAIDCAYPATKDHVGLASSLVAQVLTCIGSNRRAKRPVKMWITELPKIAGECKWERVKDDEKLLQSAQTTPQAAAVTEQQRSSIATRLRLDIRDPASFDPFTRAILWNDSRFNNLHTPSSDLERKWECEVDERRMEEMFDKEKVVYLSADSQTPLGILDPSRLYVIGGLVDRTITTGVSYARAKKGGFPTARLPIRECIGSISKGASLNIDTVFKIVLDVAQAQHEVRKYHPNTAEKDITSILPTSLVKQQWTFAMQNHIPARYWKQNIAVGQGKVRNLDGSVYDTRSKMVKEMTPPRFSSTPGQQQDDEQVVRSGSTYLRKLEYRIWFQLIQRPTWKIGETREEQ